MLNSTYIFPVTEYYLTNIKFIDCVSVEFQNILNAHFLSKKCEKQNTPNTRDSCANL